MEFQEKERPGPSRLSQVLLKHGSLYEAFSTSLWITNINSLAFDKLVEKVHVVKDTALEAPSELPIRSIDMLQTISDKELARRQHIDFCATGTTYCWRYEVNSSLSKKLHARAPITLTLSRYIDFSVSRKNHW